MHPFVRRRRRILPALAVTVLACGSFALIPRAGPTRDERAVAAGESLFRIYCATCHGASARGDGSTAAYLTVKPSDLTRLARRNGGEFPIEQARRIIDGREEVRGHGEREMPLWGLAFRNWDVDTSQEDEAQSHIDQLVRYLESIQRK